MPLIRKLVDIEAVVVAHLKADAALGALVGGPGASAKVSTEIPASFPPAGEGRVQVFRATSTVVDPATNHLERAVVQVNTYGPSKEAAWDVTSEAARALLQAPGAAHEAAVVSAVDRVTGPTWSRDPSTKAPRYTSSFAVTVHPG